MSFQSRLCPLWYAAKVLGQADGLTDPDADCQHVDVINVLRDRQNVDI